MIDAAPTVSNPQRRTTLLVIALLAPQFIAIFGLFPLTAFGGASSDLRVLAVGLALFTIVTLAGVVRRRPWAPWAVLVVASFQATIDLCALAIGVQPTLAALSLVLLLALSAVLFAYGIPASPRISIYQRILFAFVCSFAAWVAGWGLFLPTEITSAIPMSVPPLHARFLGAMYLSGAVFMLLGMIARRWSEVRVVTLMLGVWTGLLGLVSALHLDAFDWSLRTTWFWFVAYIAYPLIALWIVWCQRGESGSDGGAALSRAMRSYLVTQGAIAVVLAAFLLAVPAFMTTVWPWAIQALVAQIYGAPFMSFGLGSLYAARQSTWSEVRIVIIGTLVFAAGVLVASTIHASLFDPHTISAWLWFGGFAVASLALLFFLSLSSLRGSASSA